MPISRCYKWDWRLVPKTEEDSIKKFEKEIKPPNVIPDKLYFAPLHEHLIMQQRRTKGNMSCERPYMQRIIRKLPYNRAVLESEKDKLEKGDTFSQKTPNSS